VADETISVGDLRRRVADFVAARDWGRFHTPRNLSVSIALEAAELMEHFQWLTEEQATAALSEGQRRAQVADELADVVIYGLSLANALDIDLSDAILGKMARNEDRFPVDRWRGRARGVENEGRRTARD
jgi:NTP pyrophosphatase (non-canonical NTP hydrolase)